MGRLSSPRVGPVIHGGSVAVGNAVAAALTTACSGSNNDLVYTARERGTNSNSIHVRYVVSGASTALSVSVSGNDITVTVATDGSSAATSTAAQVAAAIEASTPANALVSVANAASNNGTGVVAAFSYTALSGGVAWVIGAPGSGIATRRGH